MYGGRRKNAHGKASMIVGVSVFGKMDGKGKEAMWQQESGGGKSVKEEGFKKERREKGGYSGKTIG